MTNYRKKRTQIYEIKSFLFCSGLNRSYQKKIGQRIFSDSLPEIFGVSEAA